MVHLSGSRAGEGSTTRATSRVLAMVMVRALAVATYADRWRAGGPWVRPVGAAGRVVTRSVVQRTIAAVGLILAMGCAAACGDASDVSDASDASEGGTGLALPQIGVAGLADLTGPWRAQPLRLDEALARRIAETCSHDMEGPPFVPAQIIDVRGAGVASVRLSGPTTTIGCDALQITRDGDIVGAGGGWRGNQPEALPAIGPTQIVVDQRGTIGGGSLTVEGWSVIGRVGDGIASVTVEPAGGPLVQATVQNGWFAAWWLGHPDIGGNRPAIAPAARIRGFDVLGQPVAESTLQPGR